MTVTVTVTPLFPTALIWGWLWGRSKNNGGRASLCIFERKNSLVVAMSAIARKLVCCWGAAPSAPSMQPPKAKPAGSSAPFTMKGGPDGTPINEECPICYEDSINWTLPCGHGFHEACLREWMIRQKRCPVCKRW